MCTHKRHVAKANDVVIETRKKNPLPVNIGIERSKEFKCTYKPKLKFLNVFLKIFFHLFENYFYKVLH